LTAELPILRRDGSIRAIALVDIEYVDGLSEFRWLLHTHGYACRSVEHEGLSRLVLLHRQVLGLDFGVGMVDHINRDKLDNRRANLRLTDNSHNRWNSNPVGHGASSELGVCWDSGKQRWRVAIGLDGRIRYLGRYRSEAEAIAVARTFRATHDPNVIRPFNDRDPVVSQPVGSSEREQEFEGARDFRP
jgi:HNH endonuclease